MHEACKMNIRWRWSCSRLVKDEGSPETAFSASVSRRRTMGTEEEWNKHSAQKLLDKKVPHKQNGRLGKLIISHCMHFSSCFFYKETIFYAFKLLCICRYSKKPVQNSKHTSNTVHYPLWLCRYVTGTGQWILDHIVSDRCSGGDSLVTLFLLPGSCPDLMMNRHDQIGVRPVPVALTPQLPPRLHRPLCVSVSSDSSGRFKALETQEWKNNLKAQVKGQDHTVL